MTTIVTSEIEIKPKDPFAARFALMDKNKQVFDKAVESGDIKHGNWAVVVNGVLVKQGSSADDVLLGISEDCYCHKAGSPPTVFQCGPVYFEAT